MKRRLPTQSAHSLVELLVVVGIIGILVSLIAPAASRVYSKAKAMDWDNKGYPWKVVQQARPFYSQLKTYPKFTPEQLRENNVIDAQSLKFLQSPYVEFHPFSSSEPDDFVVIRFGWSGEFTHEIKKETLTEPIEND